MEKIEQTIMKFIEKMNYLKDENVLGIIFYGSYLTGYYHEMSDIDIHVIKKNTKDIIRGVKVVDKYKIEYFEKDYEEIIACAELEHNNQANALLSIVGNGKIIFDRNGIVEGLQKYIKSKYDEPLPKLEEEDAKEMVCILDNKMIKLEKKYSNKNPDFNHLYHITIEKIRKFYHRLSGCPAVQTDKVVRVYTDYDYRMSFSKGEIPDSKFIDLYLKCVYCDGDNAEKMEIAKDLFNYSKRNVNVNPNDYRILIKSRCNPNNYNHK